MGAVKNTEVGLIDEMCNKFIMTDSFPWLSNQLIGGKAGLVFFVGRLVIKKQREDR